MAKKKVTQQADDHKHEAPPPPHYHQSHHPTPMDDPAEKLETLKNLNSILLKETTERRQQVDSLAEANQALESALNSSAMDKMVLQKQLSQAAEHKVALELEKGVVSVFMGTQLKEMEFCLDRLVVEKNEIECANTQRDAEIVLLKGEVNGLAESLQAERGQLSRISREKDEMKNDFDSLVGEAKRLREQVIEVEKREGKLREEVEKQRMEGEKLMKEKDEKVRAVNELKKERDLALSNLTESARVIEKLKEEIDGVTREKNEIEKQKNAQELKIIGLDLELKQLNETSKALRKEEALMRANITDLEKSLGQAMEKEKEMAMEIGALLKEKKQNEQTTAKLTEKRDSIEKDLHMVQRELEYKQRKIDEILRVKDEIEQVKITRESDIVELHRELDQLRNVIYKSKEVEEKNKQLLSEVNHYRNVVDEVMLERDEIKKGFDEEENKVKSLMLQVAGMEAKIKQTEAELGQIRRERERLVERNKMRESHAETLRHEKGALERSLLEAQRDSDDLRAKIESSNQALAMLKSTAALVCQSKNDMDTVEEGVFNEKMLEEERFPYAEDLDTIRNAFRNKNKMVKDMKQQLGSLQNSLVEAHRKKSLWTVISSATTILSAALIAFVARGR